MAKKPRRTPPVEQQVIEAKIKSIATIKKRLIDFDTNSYELQEQHKQWLQSVMRRLMSLTTFKVQLHGFASKQGSVARNKILSTQRMNAVLSFLQTVDNRVMANARTFEELGESQSTGSEHDDLSTAQWRAVEVHIFDQNPPPPILPGKEVKPNIIPLPGGERHQEWAITMPFGFTLANYIGVSFNIVIIKTNSFITMGEEKRGYVHIAGGAGMSAGFNGLSLLQKILQTIATGVSASSPTFTTVKTTFPMTWEEMGRSDVTVGGGTILIRGSALIGFNTIVTHHGNTGFLVQEESKFSFYSGNTSIGLGVFGGTGFLKRIDGLDKVF